MVLDNGLREARPGLERRLVFGLRAPRDQCLPDTPNEPVKGARVRPQHRSDGILELAVLISRQLPPARKAQSDSVPSGETPFQTMSKPWYA